MCAVFKFASNVEEFVIAMDCDKSELSFVLTCKDGEPRFFEESIRTPEFAVSSCGWSAFVFPLLLSAPSMVTFCSPCTKLNYLDRAGWLCTYLRGLTFPVC